MQQQQQQQQQMVAPATVTPLRLAIINQVDFHLHVVAGAMHVLKQLQSMLGATGCSGAEPITVYLTDKVLNHNHFGFMDWLHDSADGFAWRDCQQLSACDADSSPAAYDLAWFISPEWDVAWTAAALRKLQPKLALLYVHNGHMPEHDWRALLALSSPDVPLLTMSPHVADYVSKRLQQQDSGSGSGGAMAADWVLPIWPYEPPADDATLPTPHAAQDVSGSQQHLSGFVISGSIDKSLRDYDSIWQQVRAAREQLGRQALQNFQLKIIGDMFSGFGVPDDLEQFVVVHKSPPDAVFYQLVHESRAIVPALGNPAYYTCKLTSAVITSLMTGVPVIADSRFLAAYRMMHPDSVVLQRDSESELDVMLRTAAISPADMAATRAAVRKLCDKINSQAISQLAG